MFASVFFSAAIHRTAIGYSLIGHDGFLHLDFIRVHQSLTHHLVMSLQILDGSRRLRHLRHHPVHPVIGSIVNVQQMGLKFAGIHQLPVQLALMLFQVGQPRTAIFADVHVHLYRFGVYRQIGNEVVSNSNISQSIFHCDPLSPLRVVV